MVRNNRRMSRGRAQTRPLRHLAVVRARPNHDQGLVFVDVSSRESETPGALWLERTEQTSGEETKRRALLQDALFPSRLCVYASSPRMQDIL